MVEDRPLENAVVTFVPDGEGRMATGITDKNGNFALTTFSTGDGAIPGDYKVTVTLRPKDADPALGAWPQDVEGFKKRMQQEVNRAKRYQHGPPADVRAQSNDPWAPKGMYGNASKTPLKCRVPTDGKVTFKVERRGGKKD
jgi:hypothetical protein